MATRRGRIWLPFSSGPAPVTLTVLTSARFFIPTIAEVEQGREFSRYTIMRLIFNLEAEGNTNKSILTLGLILLPEGTGVAVHSPESQPTAQWSYHEEIMVKPESGRFDRFSRDVATKRMARGLHDELFFYITERSNITNVTYHLSGRVLLLEA